MGISAEDFENPPPKSLDPEASERVRKVTSKRDRERRGGTETVVGIEDSQTMQSREVVESKEPSMTSERANISTIESTFFLQDESGNIRSEKGGRRGFVPKPTIKKVEKNEPSDDTDSSASTNRGKENFLQTKFREQLQKTKDLRATRRERFENDFADTITDVRDFFTIRKPSGNIVSDFATGTPSLTVLRSERVRDYLGRGIAEVPIGALQTVPVVVETTENIVGSATASVLFKEERERQREVVQEEGLQAFVEPFKDPSTFVSAGIGLAGAGAGTRFIERAREGAYRRGRTFVDPETIFDPEALRDVEAGKKSFPMAESIEKLEKDFGRGERTRVVSAGPEPLKGDVVGEGPRGAKNNEDTGLYSGPEGRGSPFFLRTTVAERLEPKIQLFPKPSRPTVNLIEVEGVNRIPRKVLETNDQTIINEFLRANPEKTFITSNVERAFDPKLKGRTTGEAESVITPKSNIPIVDNDKFTIVGGRTVRIDERKLTGESPELVTIRTGSKSSSSGSSSGGRSDSVGVTPPVINYPSATTSSLSGLEVSTTPTFSQVSSASSPSSSSLSRTFVPPSSSNIIVSPSRTPFYPVSSSPKRRSRGGRSNPLTSTYTPPSSSPSPVSSGRSGFSRGSSSVYSPSRSPQNAPITQSFFRNPTSFSRRSRRTPLFNVQVVQKGRFVTIGKARTRREAILKGRQAVGSTALRTFRVRRGVTPIRISTAGFRRSKSQPFGVVERSKSAINTAGELEEISKKGRRRRLL